MDAPIQAAHTHVVCPHCHTTNRVPEDRLSEDSAGSAGRRCSKELEPQFRFVKVNTDEEHALAARHGIRGIPTLAIFRQGVEVARTSGAMDATRFVAWVRQNA